MGGILSYRTLNLAQLQDTYHQALVDQLAQGKMGSSKVRVYTNHKNDQSEMNGQ